MTFASLAIFSTLLAARFVVAAPDSCQLMGNVSLLWGTTTDTLSTATPIGWSTSATAPTDANGHGLLAVRSTISPTLWGAYACTGAAATGGGGGGGGGGPVGGGGGAVPRANGGTTSGPPGGGGGGGGTAGGGTAGGGGGGGASTGVINMFGAIADNSTGLCLTASSLDLPNITITRASCINPVNVIPDFTQGWQWSVTEFNGTLLAVADSLVFMGLQGTTPLALDTPTDYVPALVGSGVGAYVALEFLQGQLNPADATIAPGLLVSFVTPTA